MTSLRAARSEDVKRVLLIDVDSTIPNLALMKISGYHKTKGDIVGFNIDNPDLVYASVIFNRNKHLVDGLKFLYPKAKINIGGSGYDLKKKLPVEKEHLAPIDYSLYPENDSYYGFTTRGCIRNCHFCIVPKKEGRFYRYDSVRNIVSERKEESDCQYIPGANLIGIPKGGYEKITLLDNNILADKEWFMRQTDEIISRNLRVDFNQGLDIRLLDDEIADRLKLMKPVTVWKFAFDNLNYKDAVLKGIETLKEAGINTRNDAMFYVYMHDDSDFESALERCNILRIPDPEEHPEEWGAGAFVMVNQDVKRTQRMTNLKRWCLPWIFWTSPFEDYKKGMEHQTLDRFINTEEAIL